MSEHRASERKLSDRAEMLIDEFRDAQDVNQAGFYSTPDNQRRAAYGNLSDYIAEVEAKVARIREVLTNCALWHRSDKWRESPNREEREQWAAHGKSIDAALEETK